MRSFGTLALLLGATLFLSACTAPQHAANTASTTLQTTAGEPSMTEADRPIQTIAAQNGVKFQIVLRSTIYDAPQNTWGNGTNYPTVIRLSQSGKLLASFEVADSGLAGKPTRFRIMESSDDGESWHKIGEVVETVDLSLEACWNPCLYELTAPLGDLPAGTLLLSGVSIDPAQAVKSHISLWKSQDSGKTWEQISVLAQGKGVEDGGVWEPVLYQADGLLYCFYSDETQKGYDQAIVYRTSADGIQWSEPTLVVAADDPDWRPGMVSFTPMGNGKFFMVYELFGDWEGCPIYYKTTDSITDWNASDLGKPLIADGDYYLGSAPQCIWTPAGGDFGTLIVSAVYGKETPNRLLVSFDYGKTFEPIENPLPYTDGKGGYSAAFCLSVDGCTLYYANTVDGKGDKSRIAFARIRIE